MNFILFDDKETRTALLPFTFTRPIAAIRIGIFTIAEKWQNHLNAPVSYQTEEYLHAKYPLVTVEGEENLFINGSVCPTPNLVRKILALQPGEKILKGRTVIAYRDDATKAVSPGEELTILHRPWDIFVNNGKEIRADFDWVKKHRKSAGVSDPHTIVYNPSQVFIEEGAKIHAAILNAENGPIYIGKDAEVMEGAVIRGAAAICEGAVLAMQTRLRGDITIGPYSKVGGEISNSVIFGYTNKGHDGYLGNSVIGEWCNLGAATNNSNMKNNYSDVRVYSYKERYYVDTERQFCGLFMADHSRCGINTMFNTGTVVGVSANIFGGDFPPKHVPSFSWGGANGIERFDVNKALVSAEKAMSIKQVEITEQDRDILRHVNSIV